MGDKKTIAEIKLGKHVINESSPCFVIAEIGHNHQGDLEKAIHLIDEAKRCDAHAVKLQKRFNKVLYTKEMYNKPYENENSFGKTYGEHREKLEFSMKEYMILQKHARKRGLVFLATAFDFKSVDFLEKIGVSAYKVASADITNHPLLEYIARTNKPVIFSTGASNLSEIRQAYEVIKKYHNKICIMQCTAAYPANPEDIHLNVIITLKNEFTDAVIGYSGHDNGIILPVVAYILGARVVEKHFTLNRAMKGSDHKFSLEPQGLGKMVRDLERTRVALGSFNKECLPIEVDAKTKMGKSIVLKSNLKKQVVVTRKVIDFKSPGHGIPPSIMNTIIGRKVKKSLPKEHILTFEDLK